MSGRVLKFASGIDVREGNGIGQRGADDIRVKGLFSEEAKEDVTMDLTPAEAPLPG